MLMKFQLLAAAFVIAAVASCDSSANRKDVKKLEGDGVWYFPKTQSILIRLTKPNEEYLLVSNISKFSYAPQLSDRLARHRITAVTVSIEAYDEEYTKSPEHNGRTAWVNIGFETPELTNKDLPIGVAMGKPLDDVVFGSLTELSLRLQGEEPVAFDPIPVRGQFVLYFVRGVEHHTGP